MAEATPQLTLDCVRALSDAYYAAFNADYGKRTIGTFSAVDTENWVEVEGHSGELSLMQDPNGRRWLLDADEPAHGVDVTDVALVYAEPASSREPFGVDSAAAFNAALPAGWVVECSVYSTGHLVLASHRLHGNVSIGPKKRLVPADALLLRKRVDDVMAPSLSYSQWLASGERFGFAGAVEMSSLTRALRLLAICIERGDIREADVAQALLVAGDYTLPCPIAEASNEGACVAELVALLSQVAIEHGHAEALPEEWIA